MTLIEAIEHCEAQGREETQCGLEYKQLAGWLKELDILRTMRCKNCKHKLTCDKWDDVPAVLLCEVWKGK